MQVDLGRATREYQQHTRPPWPHHQTPSKHSCPVDLLPSFQRHSMLLPMLSAPNKGPTRPRLLRIVFQADSRQAPCLYHTIANYVQHDALPLAHEPCPCIAAARPHKQWAAFSRSPTVIHDVRRPHATACQFVQRNSKTAPALTCLPSNGRCASQHTTQRITTRRDRQRHPCPGPAPNPTGHRQSANDFETS